MHGQVTRLTCSAQLGIKSRAGVSIPPDRFECKVKLKVEVLQLSGPVEVKIGLARLGSEWVAIPLLRDLGAGRAWRHALQGPFRVAHVELNELAAVFADELPGGFGRPLWRLELRFPNLLHGDGWEVKQKCFVLFTQGRVMLQVEDPQGAPVRIPEEFRLG